MTMEVHGFIPALLGNPNIDGLFSTGEDFWPSEKPIMHTFFKIISYIPILRRIVIANPWLADSSYYKDGMVGSHTISGLATTIREWTGINWDKKLTNLKNGQRLGLTGFGASAHLVLKIVKHVYPNCKLYVFARSEKERTFAKELGADWAGDFHQQSPEKLNCIIDTTPVWKPIVDALLNLKSNGRLVINAIRKESVDKDYLLKLDYSQHLWMEKEIKSVANVARSDVSEFLNLAAEIPIHPEFQEFPLQDANKALIELKERKIRGAKVLRID